MTPLNGNDPQLQEREKFVLAFNDTMLKIWREQMTLLGVIDTGRLLHSPKSLPVRADGRFIELGLSQSFLEYGLWQNFGTGKEIPRGNHGDIGRERKRKKKPWFSRKYYASVMNLRDFLSDNIAHDSSLSQDSSYRPPDKSTSLSWVYSQSVLSTPGLSSVSLSTYRLSMQNYARTSTTS